MVQSREPQLVLPEGFTAVQALWSCPTLLTEVIRASTEQLEGTPGCVEQL